MIKLCNDVINQKCQCTEDKKEGAGGSYQVKVIIIFFQASLAIRFKSIALNQIGVLIAHEGDAQLQQECVMHNVRITLDHAVIHRM